MATIKTNKDKTGNIISYKVKICLGRDEQYKQIQRTTTIPRPEGLTPAKERKEVERLADLWEQEQRADFEKNHQKQSTKDKISFADFVNKHWWPDHVEDGSHTPSTVAFYRHMSAELIEYFGQKKKLSQVDAEAVKRLVKHFSTVARTKSGEPYSTTSVQHIFNTLRNIMQYAKRFKYIQSDPCQDLSAKEKPRNKQHKIDFLAPEDARRFMDALESEPLFWRCFMNILITTGLRRGECVGLQWGDIDADNLTLKVQRNVTIDTGSPDKYHVGSTKTGEERTVPISPRVLSLLAELKKEQQEKFGAVLMPKAFIFSSTADPYRPICPTSPTMFQRRFTERHHLPKVSPHDLRHTAASLALESGANLKEIQQLLGHADPRTTMKHYSGLTKEAQRRPVQGIENILAAK